MKYPKIGIRPVIDGRTFGVRESLEEQTMNMAVSAKELIEKNCHYQDGTPVQCVISNTTIGGVAESAACEEQFSTENVVATLTVTPCWCYVSEVMDFNPNTIKAIWGFNGTERPGAVTLSAVVSAYNQYGMPCFSIYGKDVQDADDTTIPEDVQEKILRFARCAVAAGEIYGKSYVNIGGVAMGIAGSNVQSNLLKNYFGLRTEWVDMVEILRRMKLHIYDEEEFKKAKAWVKEKCQPGYDMNDVSKMPENQKKSKVVSDPEEEWDFCIKMYLITKDILFGNPKLADMGWSEEALGHNAIAAGFQGQRQWTDWLPNADFTEAIMASSFDYAGAKPPMAFATENDTLNGLSMMMATMVTKTAPLFSDVRTYWSPEAVKRVTGYDLEGKAKDGFLFLHNSGASCLDASGVCKDEEGNPVMKHYWDLKDEDIDAMMKATTWNQADRGSFRGGGYSSCFRTDVEMPVTMLRLNIVDGIGLTLQVAEGSTIALPEDVSETIEKRSDPTWPTTWVAPRLGMPGFKSVYEVMANWGANHATTVYGHVGADLITMASMLRIPVSLHNVPEEEIFRPQTWKAFGTKDNEAADYSACKHYGPRYE